MTAPTSKSTETAAAADALRIGVVFDVGGRGDKSFNDGAYAGAVRAEKELGANVRFIEPGDGNDERTFAAFPWNDDFPVFSSFEGRFKRIETQLSFLAFFAMAAEA